MAKQKSLKERLTKDIENEAPNARMQIILHLEEINEALTSGFKKKEVWQKLSDSEQFTKNYSSFVNAYNNLTSKQKETTNEPTVKAPDKDQDIDNDSQIEPTNKKHKIEAKKSFNHSAAADDDELI